MSRDQLPRAVEPGRLEASVGVAPYFDESIVHDGLQSSPFLLECEPRDEEGDGQLGLSEDGQVALRNGDLRKVAVALVACLEGLMVEVSG